MPSETKAVYQPTNLENHVSVKCLAIFETHLKLPAECENPQHSQGVYFPHYHNILLMSNSQVVITFK